MTARPYDEAELGIGAADSPPSFAPVSIRLEDKPAVRWSLLLLELLGDVAMAAFVGLAAGAGMLLFVLYR